LFLQCQQVIHDFAVKQQNLVWLPVSEDGPVRRKTYKKLPAEWRSLLLERRAPLEMYGPLVTTFTTHLSIPYTILYCLEKVFGVEQLASRTSLTLHLLGPSTGFELVHANKYEELLHLLPSLLTLDLLFVGPEVPTQFCARPPPIELCPHCQQQCPRPRMSWRFEHDVYQGDAKGPAPDLVVAMNAGLHLFSRASVNDTWHATLQTVATMGVSMTVTAYGPEEAIQVNLITSKAFVHA
jgi:splicing suppressor protein 51